MLSSFALQEQCSSEVTIRKAADSVRLTPRTWLLACSSRTKAYRRGINMTSEESIQLRCHCSRTFRSSSAMAQHLRDTPPHPPKNPNSSPPPDKLMRCSCGRSFKSEKALQQHRSMSPRHPRHPRKAPVAQTDTAASSSREKMKDGDDMKKPPTKTGGTTSDELYTSRVKEQGDDATPERAREAFSSSYIWYPGVGDDQSLCCDRCGWCGHCAGGSSRFATVFNLSLRLELQGDSGLPLTGRYPHVRIHVYGGVISDVEETSS
ncbi:hypothetical protein CCMA1212_001506 [Trichoderma ghanense]|uniref:C2H2-type domain-containing protein n=1 Tax=Trichoderma ghanense TaxID=65468 RepID=A0ABY2HDK3_9HYPO